MGMVFSHEGFWTPVPAESVIHVIEDAKYIMAVGYDGTKVKIYEK